jgi:hypothetical protein
MNPRSIRHSNQNKSEVPQSAHLGYCRLAARRPYVAVTRYKFNLTEWIHLRAAVWDSGTQVHWRVVAQGIEGNIRARNLTAWLIDVPALLRYAPPIAVEKSPFHK